MEERRYEVEQLGYRDYGVWDKKTERHVITGGLDDCEDRADQLNRANGAGTNKR